MGSIGSRSYIEIGGELGSQDLALRLIGLGELVGLWEVIIPEKLGIAGEDAARLAGKGMVMLSGIREVQSATAPQSQPSSTAEGSANLKSKE